uniref:(northern house mosquito) hypothetical protein n=1 Tax=Culex pipiens TaxID=7175 RepID=A0A8D8JE00_CULPI
MVPRKEMSCGTENAQNPASLHQKRRDGTNRTDRFQVSGLSLNFPESIHSVPPQAASPGPHRMHRRLQQELQQGGSPEETHARLSRNRRKGAPEDGENAQM